MWFQVVAALTMKDCLPMLVIEFGIANVPYSLLLVLESWNLWKNISWSSVVKDFPHLHSSMKKKLTAVHLTSYTVSIRS